MVTDNETMASVTSINGYRDTSVADPDPNPDTDPPDPPDPHVFGPPGFGTGSFYHHAKIVRKTLIPTIL
jgi:hypothetical protein